MTIPEAGYPKTAKVSPRVQFVEHTGSTNADLVVASADEEAYPHLSIIVTNDQRHGRGRLDREWETPAGSGLAASVLLRVTGLPVAARGWIPLAAGLAMRDAVAKQLSKHEVAVKWPNDVLVDGGKISGVLAEATLERDAIVVGVGVNTQMSASQLPVAHAVSFEVLDEKCDEDQLLADFVKELDSLVDNLVSAGGNAATSGLHAALVKRCATIGQGVSVQLPNDEELRGVATGIDEDGRLLVEKGDGEEVPVAAGDVVHVRRAPRMQRPDKS